MNTPFDPHTDDWLLEAAPKNDVVVSSRARLARNLPGHPFAPRSPKAQLAAIAEEIRTAITGSPYFKHYTNYHLHELSALDRRYLKEGHRISIELEKGAEHREVYVSPSPSSSIMVNEEDHLRLHALLAGFRIAEVYQQVDEVESALEKRLEFAYSPQFGYLTACPTNTGTGLRVSVMLHLIGLVLTQQIEETLSPLGNLGLVVRGAHGEHSTHTGDLFQVSNEITLGKTEEELIQILDQVVTKLIEREMGAREYLARQEPIKCEDSVLRAIGVLSHARSINSEEATLLLSRLRLGIGMGLGLDLTHEALNGLMMAVQPAHLARRSPEITGNSERDIARAAFLRAKFGKGNGQSQN